MENSNRIFHFRYITFNSCCNINLKKKKNSNIIIKYWNKRERNSFESLWYILAIEIIYLIEKTKFQVYFAELI